MATDGVVITEANDATPNIGTIFAGKSFLVTQRVPMRTNFLDRIRANGGRVVRLETQADYIIADHVRNDCPPKSLSYTFIEAAITSGALPDPNHHRAGPAPGFSRAVGSTAAPPKATRTAFTVQDDRDLWLWVQHYKSLGAHAVKGNEIYKQLEQVNPRHTYQSWRDRYVKRLINNPPDGVDVGAPAVQAGAAQVQQPALDGANEAEVHEQEDVEEEQDPDVLFLLENIDDILNIPQEDLDTVWASLADEESSAHLSADQWKRLYEEKALPAYEAKQKKEKRAKVASPVKRTARVYTPEPPEQNAEPTTPELVAMRARAAKERQVSPSVSQKRKRQTATPRGNANGRKRAKGDDGEASANEATAGGELTAQDEDNENPGELALPGEEVLPTSELNRAAKAQLIAEADPELPSQQPEANGSGNQIPQRPFQLTAENLAHQEAANGEKSTRASDLPGAGDNLSEFAEYLQSNIKGPVAEASAQQDLEGGREHDVPVGHNSGEDIPNGATEANGDMNDDVHIDLTLAEPEGGFDFSSQEEPQPGGIPAQNAWEPTQDVEMQEAPRDHAALDTQAIYAAGQQQPDFSFPSPPLPAVEDEDEEELPADPLSRPPAPVQDAIPKPTPAPRKPVQIPTENQPEPANDSEGESIESFLARLTAKGCSPASLQSALFRTSAQLQAAEVVAMYEKLGLPIPDIPEVWSAEDDAQVGTTDAKVFKALCEKKGWEEYDLRLKFLEEWRASQ